MADEREVRIQRLHALHEKGIQPYPNTAERTNTIAEVLEHFDEWQGESGDFTLVGRIRLMREMGKAAFAHIEDGTGRIQVFFRINDLGEEATGPSSCSTSAISSRYGATCSGHAQKSARCTCASTASWQRRCAPCRRSITAWRMWNCASASATSTCLPTARRRGKVFVIRSRTISAMRRYLDDHGFIEVETPILQPLYGGSDRAAIHYPSQYARSRPLPAYRRRTLPQAPDCRRVRAGLRNWPRFSQRGHRSQPQSRIYYDGMLSGLRRL